MGPETVDLVLHQSDEGRDDYRNATEEDRGQLIAQRLAASGGHQHQGVLSRKNPADDFFLQWQEAVEAEMSFQMLKHGPMLAGHWSINQHPAVSKFRRCIAR